MIRAAAGALLAYQREREYDQERQILAAAKDAGTDAQESEDAMLRRHVEHRKANPSPVRIGRPST